MVANKKSGSGAISQSDCIYRSVCNGNSLVCTQPICLCEQGPELTEKIYALLLKATHNSELSGELLLQIGKITRNYCFYSDSVVFSSDEHEIDAENQIKVMLEKRLSQDILSSSESSNPDFASAENEDLRECRVALVELMARSHAMVKKHKCKMAD